MAGIKASMSPIKKRQYMMMAFLIFIIVALATGVTVLFSKKQPVAQKAPQVTRKNFTAQGTDVDPAQVWRTSESARIKNMQEELERQRRELGNLKPGNASGETQQFQEQIAALQAQIADLQQQPSAPPPSGLPPQGDLGQPPIGELNEPRGAPIKGIMRVDMGNSSLPASAPSPVVKGGGTNRAQEVREGETYIPPASFTRGFLLSGLDAPTGGQAQQNPHPVVIEMIDPMSLPNQQLADYQKCRILANGIGDLSSERAFLRLERLACVRQDGSVIDIAVRGYIADQTGKAGIRGRLISKQGQVLARALVSGIASGIGNAFAEGNYVNSVSPLGSTRTMKDGREFELGISQGVGSALNKLADYYIKTAENMYPVIEVDAGLPVDIVFTQGFAIPPLDSNALTQP
jgi:conjugal transfer pilus assembly protein TraB